MSENVIDKIPFEHIVNSIEDGDIIELEENRNILFVRKVVVKGNAKIICPATSKMMMIGGK